MNKVYSIVWSEVRQAWIVASETAMRHGKPSTTRRVVGATLVTGLLSASMQLQAAPPITPPPVNTLPTGGTVVAGQAGISQSGTTLNINQTTGKAAINWNTFSIGANANVNITQPGKSSVLLNRVTGSDPSQIYGRMNANGQVFLINPNGILFGKGARLDVGGLVASTLNIKDSDFLSGNYRFSGNGGSVVNQGELLGNYIALLAPEVRNEGVIIARQGTVALAGGKGITLSLVNNQLIDVMVDAADINTLVENKHLIQAEEGTVIMAAQSANHLLGKLVNSGKIEAKGISTDGGKVRLTASSNIVHSGSINVDAGANGKGGSAIVIANLDNANSRTDVSGTISAKGGSVSGDGGFVETSANTLKIADSARINTTAAHGKRGTWLLDPNDFIIAAAGGDITGAALGSALDISNVTIQTTVGAASCTGAACGTGTAGNGDIIFNDAVYWTTDGNVLTLDAYRNIVFNQSVVRDTGMLGMPGTAIEITYGTSGTGAAYTTSTADWVTPFSGGPVAAGNMFIQDNTAGGALTPAVILGAHTGSPLDLYLGAKNIPIYVNAVSGTSTYDGNAVPFLPAFSLAANGTSPIDIIPTLTAGMPTWNTTATHANTYNGILYTGGLTSAAYDSLAAGNAGATWTINPATLTVTLTNNAGQKTKTYDATNAAPVGFTPTYGFAGLIAGDTAATLSNTGITYTGTVHAGAANSNTLTVAGLAITGIAGGNGSLASDYVLAAPTVAAAATINPIQLTASLTNVGTTKTYDGTNAAPGGFTPTYSFTGSFLAGDTAATLNNTGAAFNGTHVVGTNSIVVSGLSIASITGGNGSLATDYALTNPGATASAAATITPIMLTATLNNAGTTKVYDGTTAAPTGFTPTYNGIVTGVNTLGTDTVNLTGTFTYNDKDVLDAATIGTTNLSVGSISGSGVGSQATDYQLTSAATSAAATITPATLSTPAVGTKVDDGIDTIAGSLIRANGVTVNGVTEYFTFTGTGLLPDNLVNNNATATGNLASVNDLALDTANGLNGALASNYAAPPAYSAVTDFDITVTSVASSLTAVEIIQRTIAGNQERAKRLGQGNYWENITETGKNKGGVTQDKRDTVTQAVQKVLQKLCGDNCTVDEDEVAKYLGGVTGCSSGFVLSGGSCSPEQKKAQASAPAPDNKPAQPIVAGNNDPETFAVLVQRFQYKLTDAELEEYKQQISQKKMSVGDAIKKMLETDNERTTALYGTDTLAYVNDLYVKLANRAADFAGLLYWAGEIDAGRLTKTQAAKAIFEGLLGQREVTYQPPDPTPMSSAPPSRTISQTNKDIKSVVEYFKDAGADNSRMAQYVNRANNVGGAGSTPVTDADVDWVTNYVNGKGKNVTRGEVEAWLKGGQVTTPQPSAQPSPSASPSAQPSPSASPSASPSPSPSAQPSPSPSTPLSGAISGSRIKVDGKPGIRVEGKLDLTNVRLKPGTTIELRPMVRVPGQTAYTEGTARPIVKSDGSFEWERKTTKKSFVYFEFTYTNDQGETVTGRTNLAIISAQ